MECFDKETEFQRRVCASVSVSRKGQFRTKSVTHNLRGRDMVLVLFTKYLVKNNTYTFSSQTHAHSLSAPSMTLCG